MGVIKLFFLLIAVGYSVESTKTDNTWSALASHFETFLQCGDQGLCAVRYPPVMNETDNDDDGGPPWNTTQVVGPNDMADIQ